MGPILGTLISRSQPASRRAMAWRPDHVGRRDARGRARESRLRCQAAIRIHREAFADVAGCTHLFGPPAEIARAICQRLRAELGLPISVGVARTKHLAKIASQVAKPDGLVVVDPDTELKFLHQLPVELMWGVGPATGARLAEIGVLTIGQLAKTPGWSLKRLLGPAAGEKLTALAWNRDPREIKTRRQARSAGAQSALGSKPAEERIFRPTLLHLADRIGSRLRAKSRLGRTVTVCVRFANLNSVTRSVTLDAPISATVILAELAEELVRASGDASVPRSWSSLPI
ncbi:MAG: polymerase [Bradyrhizobium sp.]|nr:polymerase [Bradyrhizobium sp.]